MKKLTFLVPALAIILMGAGCSGAAPASPAASGNSAKADKGVALPADFPKEIPVYEKGTVEDATSDSLDMVTKDGMEEAYAWYSGKLTTAGWKATVENKKEGKNISAVWEKGNQSMPISIFTSGGSTYINISLTTY